MKIKLLIFDFDGTLVDSKKIWYNAILKILKEERVYCPECDAKLTIHFGKKIRDILTFMEIDNKKIEKISEKIYKEFEKNSKKVRLCKGIEELKEIKVNKIIVSNSRSKEIKKVLGNKSKLFEEIYGGEKFDTKDKIIKKILKKRDLKKEEAVYIGDRIGDVLVAREVGCISVIISNKCSWNSREEILKAEPDFILSSLKDLKKICYRFL